MPSHVLIIGAGIGGLCLAQGLKKARIPFHVYERDLRSDYRAQGYRLRISGDGAAALEYTLTPELWTLFERTCCQTVLGMTNINALDGSVTASRAGAGQPGPIPRTADRTVLRNTLMTGLEENISFGKEFNQYTVTPAGVTAHFNDGSFEEGVLLVGADGVRSPVRKQYLPNHRPVDTNGRCIYGKTVLTTELTNRFPAHAMRWMTFVVALKVDKTPLTLLLEPIRFPASEPNIGHPKDYIYWVLLSQKDTFGLTDDELLKLSSEDSVQLSLQLTEKWDPSLRSLLELQDVSQSSALRICSAIPNIPPWSPSARITLLGDAIHVMSPTGGVGANTALQDAANLSKLLAEDGISSTSIGRYEEIMRSYAQAGIERSYFGGKKMFGQQPFEECKPVDL
ncbi:MAG: hypothetical protein M1830_002512 [Pleopsidium flavum]|nr:MAG: hypothetical protein M1830_002512 [Pleopsidium flavum]